MLKLHWKYKETTPQRKLEETLTIQSAAEANLEIADKACLEARAALELVINDMIQTTAPTERKTCFQRRTQRSKDAWYAATRAATVAASQISKERRSLALAAIVDAEEQVRWLTAMVSASKKAVVSARADLVTAEAMYRGKS